MVFIAPVLCDQFDYVRVGVGFEFFFVVGDEIGVDGEAELTGAVGFDEFLAVLFLETALECGAEVADRRAVLGVINAAGALKIGHMDPAAPAFFQFQCQAQQEEE